MSSAVSPGTYSKWNLVADTTSGSCGKASGTGVTIVVTADTTPPTLSITSPATGSYVKTPAVPVSGTASDTGSGVQKVEVQVESGPFNLASGTTSWTYTTAALSDGSHTITAKATDNTGNSATTSVTITVDTIPPTISASATAGGSPYASATWTKENVVVHFACTDGGSGVASVTADTTVSTEGADQSVPGTCTDNAGNSANTSFDHINIDKTRPDISGVRSPGPNANGWNNVDVTVHFECTDALSTVDTVTADTTLSGEGAGQSVLGTCTDKAGNSASTTVSDINIDLTAPIITGSQSPDPNANGWNNVDVTVTFTCGDSLSGVDSPPLSPQVVSTEGSGQSRTGTCTDKAGNSASTTVSDIKIDKTAPTITGSRTPLANVNGWNNVDVTVSFACSDSLSGLASGSPPADTILTGEGAGQSVTGTCSDLADNSASDMVSGINIDKTKPVVTGSRDPQANTYGWNNGPVTVHFECTDALSGPDPTSITPDTILNTEGAGQSATGTCSDKAGNSADAATVGDINIDLTDPTITGSRTPGANANGWNNVDVTVHFECSDGLSGLATGSPPSDTVLTNEGAGQSVLGTCYDLAGNSASATVGDISIDKTVPDISGSRSPDPNANGWNNVDVTVTFTCIDTLSGVDVPPVSPQVVNTEGLGQARSATCTDKAGNTASATVSGISIDKTPPTVTATPSRLPDSNGWYNHAFTVSFSGTDSLSGIDTCDATKTYNDPDGTGLSVSGSCTDKAGNSASASFGPFKYDATAPTITISSPAPQDYILNQPVASNYLCADATSGVDPLHPCTGPVPSGSNFDTSSVLNNPHQFTVTVTDIAGNPASSTVNYNVIYSSSCGRSVLPPLQQVILPIPPNPSLSTQLTKAYKQGSTLPIKFYVCDYNGVRVGTATAKLQVFKVSNGVDTTDPVEVLDSGSSNDNGIYFRYDSSGQQYIYNLSTKNQGQGTYKIVITLNDGTQIITYYELRK